MFPKIRDPLELVQKGRFRCTIVARKTIEFAFRSVLQLPKLAFYQRNSDERVGVSTSKRVKLQSCDGVFFIMTFLNFSLLENPLPILTFFSEWESGNGSTSLTKSKVKPLLLCGFHRRCLCTALASSVCSANYKIVFQRGFLCW